MKGLSARFNIENGKFKLIDGKEKASENIWFYCIFNKRRNYVSDFGSIFVSLSQRTSNYLVLNRTLILGSLIKGIQKYVPNVIVKNIDIGYLGNNRRDYSMVVEYDVKADDKSVSSGVTFV